MNLYVLLGLTPDCLMWCSDVVQVVVLVVDGEEGQLRRGELALASVAQQEGRAFVVAANKVRWFLALAALRSSTGFTIALRCSTVMCIMH